MASRYITFIGDVHGCFHTLKALLEKIPKSDNRIVFMGDIINKGIRSYEVFSFVKKNNYEMLLGNHEYLCMNRNHKWARSLWLNTGGRETIHSIKKALNISAENQIQEVLAEMAYFFDYAYPYLVINTHNGKKIIATHGGINNRLYKQNNYNVALALSVDLRIPGSYLFNKGDLANMSGYIQVIGHQPTEYPYMESNKNYRIDTGCVYKKRNLGILTALTFDIEEDNAPQFYHQACID